MPKALRKIMKRGREIIVLILCVLSEIALAFQLKQPQHFASSAIIIAGTNDTEWFIARILVLLSMIGMAVFALSVWRGNAKGKLHISYFIMLIQAAIMFVLPILSGRLNAFMQSEKVKLNTGLYIITMILAVLVLALFILREKGAMRVMPKLSTLMLLVIIGQFATNGIFAKTVVAEPTIYMLTYGAISTLPYLSIFVFEYFVVEPTMRKFR